MIINQSTLMDFQEDYAEAMLNLEAKYGVAIELKSISCDPSGFIIKIDCRNLDAEGRKVMDFQHEMRAVYEVNKILRNENTRALGVIGKTFRLRNGDIVKIMDFNTRNSKYPLIYSTSGGKQYKGPTNLIYERIQSTIMPATNIGVIT